MEFSIKGDDIVLKRESGREQVLHFETEAEAVEAVTSMDSMIGEADFYLDLSSYFYGINSSED